MKILLKKMYKYYRDLFSLFVSRTSALVSRQIAPDKGINEYRVTSSVYRATSRPSFLASHKIIQNTKYTIIKFLQLKNGLKP